MALQWAVLGSVVSFALVFLCLLFASFFVLFRYVFLHRLAIYSWGLLLNKLSHIFLIYGRERGPRCNRSKLPRRMSYSPFHNLLSFCTYSCLGAVENRLRILYRFRLCMLDSFSHNFLSHIVICLSFYHFSQ